MVIPSEDDITAKANEQFTLLCQSNSNATWVVVDPYTNNIDFKLDVRYSINESSDQMYEAALEFSSVTVNDVKYYYCVKEQYLILAETLEDLDNEEHNFHATKIYLFVEGSHLLPK